ncbi:DUF4174 domain-containing protein [Paracoccus aestuariivivens]|uniref:DUF4174 domain-containing protein n=2 Tax=Paracoccus aestuariivivens TaxID=1820333 RepID=A0A6L6J677_9RHOB|nr:DUF4174 domain-containing protein [Paracoccus aestuariivivens]MTH77450.1 DUF4174 domain-containing protein [Paracoccus aestuariivivens]
MGPKPQGGDSAHQPYVRGEVPAARDTVGEGQGRAQSQLTVLSASEAEPSDFVWQARPVVIFADTPADPAYIEQIAALKRDPRSLILRDVVVITDADPSAATTWRRQLRPEGFSLVLLDKDGQVKQRKPAPWSTREISRAIDKFPLRLQEIGRAAMH